MRESIEVGSSRVIVNTCDARESSLPDETVTIEQYHRLGGLPINLSMVDLPQPGIEIDDPTGVVVQLRPRQ